MAHSIPAEDFRGKVWLLDPDDFALSDGQLEPPPSDLVDENIWSGITTFAQDVSIRTSNRHGTALKDMYDLWGAWLESIELRDEQDPLDAAMVDAIDEFQASIFNALHGYYRQAIACLRSVLDLVVVGAYCQLCGSPQEYREWRDGTTEIRFDSACGGLTKNATVQALSKYLQSQLRDGIVDQKSGTYEGGWARRLYAKLCKYAHSRPQFTNADMWASNGPIYVSEAFATTAELYFETVALCFVLVKIVRPSFNLPETASQIFGSGRIVPTKVAYVTYEYLFPPPTAQKATP